MSTADALKHAVPAIRHDLPDLRLGFVPLTDAAPLLVAEVKGFFHRHGLSVSLAPSPSWSALRDRVVFGVYDGAHILGPMPLAIGLGLGGVHARLHVTATLGRNGNTVVLGGTLSEKLGEAGFPLTATDFAAVLRRRAQAGREKVRLAVVFPFSSHNYLLRHWLAEGGIDPDHDLSLVVLPPPALPEALAARKIDGFCAGEPWGSRAVDLRVGRIVLTSSRIWPDHPEKVLAVPAALTERDPARVDAATAAVMEAANWLSFAENRAEAARILHARALPGVPPEVIALALEERLQPSPDLLPSHTPRVILHSAAATYPDPGDARWFFGAMRRWGHVSPDTTMPDGIWRPDIWRRAAQTAGLLGLAEASPVFNETPPTIRSPIHD
ncbi:MAG: CmpA/NrtA family ABC transporter substrate-binding protein [Acetobacteraceae bacterium]